MLFIHRKLTVCVTKRIEGRLGQAPTHPSRKPLSLSGVRRCDSPKCKSQAMSPNTQSSLNNSDRAVSLGQRVAVAGFVLFAVFAPHSIAGAEIALGIAAAGWLIRTISSRRTGFRRSQLDLPIWLFFLWTIASAFLSAEPRISIAKLQSVCVLFLFYLTQAVITRRTAVLLVSLMILSGVAGTLFSVYDLVRGRGVVVESVASDSPFRMIETGAEPAVDPLLEPPRVQVEKG